MGKPRKGKRTPNNQRPSKRGREMGNEPRKYDLDDRRLEYSASVVRLVESMAKKNVVRESPTEPYGGDS